MSMPIVSDFYAAGQNQSNRYFNFADENQGSVERSSETKCVLVVDDETLIAHTLTEILNGSGFEAVTACTAEDALQLAQAFQPDILMSDLLMPKKNVVELAIAIRQAHPTT